MGSDRGRFDKLTLEGASRAFSLDFYRTDVETAIPLPSLLTGEEIEAEARLTPTGTQLSFVPELDALVSYEGSSASVELFGEIIAPLPARHGPGAHRPAWDVVGSLGDRVP